MKTEAAAFVALCMLGGCTRSDRQGYRGVVRDSSGITIAENRGPYDQWQLAPVPEIRIGTMEGDSAYQFYHIRFAGRLSDGRIVAADDSREVRWYTANGIFRSAVGRPGGGPGEFGLIGGVLITPADTIVVYDPRRQRVTWLSPEQEYVRDVSLRELPRGTTTLLAQTVDGRLALATSVTPFAEVRPGITYSRDTLSVFLLSAGGQLETVKKTPGKDSGVWAEFSGGRPERSAAIGLPFAHLAFAVATADHFAIVDGKLNEVRFYDWNGSIELISRRPDLDAIALTEDDRRRYVAEAVKGASGGSGPASRSVMEENARNQVDALPPGRMMPAFDAILSDSEGGMWLRDFVPRWVDKKTDAWTVINPLGRVERRIVVPADIALTHVGQDYVTGVVRDSLLVEYVVVYRLEKT